MKTTLGLIVTALLLITLNLTVTPGATNGLTLAATLAAWVAVHTHTTRKEHTS